MNTTGHYTNAHDALPWTITTADSGTLPSGRDGDDDFAGLTAEAV